MDIFSFLLGIASDVAKTWINDLIRGKKDNKISDQQVQLIKDLIEKQMELQPKMPNISPDIMAKKVVEQLIVMSQNPNFPLIVANGAVSLKEPARGKPLIGSEKKEKWADKEISARFYKLDQVIKERYSEMGETNNEMGGKEFIKERNQIKNVQNEQYKSPIPSQIPSGHQRSRDVPDKRKRPLPLPPRVQSEHQQEQDVQVKPKLPPLDNTGKFRATDDWKQKIEKAAEQIEKRRQNEIKPALRNEDNDDDNNAHS